METKLQKQLESSLSSYENLISEDSMRLSRNSPNYFDTPDIINKQQEKSLYDPKKHEYIKNGIRQPTDSNLISSEVSSRRVSKGGDLYDSVISPKKSPNSIKSFKFSGKSKKTKKTFSKKETNSAKESQVIFQKFRELFRNFEEKTQMMAKDFENLSKELMERMQVFNNSKIRYQKASDSTHKIELAIDNNHQKIQKLSEALKWAKGKNFAEKQNRQILRKKIKEDSTWLPFKTKKQVLKENLDLFKGYYQKKQILQER
jgi:hypothetical protein